MCGIVGIIKNRAIDWAEESALKKAFRDLLFVDQLRGEDSTGVYVVRNKPFHTETKAPPRAQILKMAVNANEFLRTKAYKEDVEDKWMQFKYIVGHNRFATSNKNEITADAAHPYRHKDIILCHNGTLYNKKVIEDLLENKEGFLTDSEALTHLVAEIGIEEALNTADGSWSLVYTNLEQGTLNFVRNKDRPMYIATLKNQKGMMFASEKNFIWWAAARHGVELKTIYTPNPHQHISINIEKYEYDIKPLTIKEKPVVVYQGHQGWHRNAYFDEENEYGNSGHYPSQRQQARFAAQKEERELKRTKPAAKLRKIDEKLKQYQFHFGEKVSFKFIRFTAYKKKIKGKTVGNLYCTLDSGNFMNVLIPNVKRDEWDKFLKLYWPSTKERMDKGIYMLGNIVNIHDHGGGGDYLIVNWHGVCPKPSLVDGRVRVDDILPPTESSPSSARKDVRKKALETIKGKSKRYFGPCELMLGKEEFEALIRAGCAMCGDPLFLIHNGTLAWMDVGHDHAPICGGCAAEPTNKDFISHPAPYPPTDKNDKVVVIH